MSRLKRAATGIYTPSDTAKANKTDTVPRLKRDAESFSTRISKLDGSGDLGSYIIGIVDAKTVAQPETAPPPQAAPAENVQTIEKTMPPTPEEMEREEKARERSLSPAKEEKAAGQEMDAPTPPAKDDPIVAAAVAGTAGQSPKE
jgi:hypothetical protein